ncbi:ubiquitin-like protein nedd8 homologue, putative [Hepatocystis sp. ex Piliocolobus tephrosceles]|nr:ubiquitin-like protein nedd8 homologue, putative [Hepatocystis sp. ex Piliocolobus tephrosceles]
MQILVKTLTGKRQSFNFEPNSSVYQIKMAIEEKEGIAAKQIRLIYSGKQMYDDMRLIDYRIVPGSTIHMILQLRGGTF